WDAGRQTRNRRATQPRSWRNVRRRDRYPGKPELRVVEWKPEAGRHDADDGVRLIRHNAARERPTADGELHRAANDASVGTKALPGAVAEHDDVLPAAGRIVVGNGPAEQRRNAKHREHVRRHAEAVHACRVAIDRHDQLRERKGGEMRQRPRAAGHADDVADVHGAEAAIGTFAVPELGARHVFVDANDLAGVLVWQRPEQHGVHDAEDRRVRAEAEGERQDDDDGEAGRAAERAARVAQIETEIVEPHVRLSVTAQRFIALDARKAADWNVARGGI